MIGSNCRPWKNCGRLMPSPYQIPRCTIPLFLPLNSIPALVALGEIIIYHDRASRGSSK